jgi:hypothetical protein
VPLVPRPRRWRAVRLLFATIATLAAMSMVPALAAGEPIIQISDDPFTNDTSAHRTEVEPDTFAFGSTWVSAFQAGRFNGEGASGIGFATSSDGGKTFVDGFLPGVTIFSDPPGGYDRATDPTVAFDLKHHVWLISFIAIHVGGSRDVLISRSGDGVHWDPPVPVAQLNARLDKNWTVCDNSQGSPFYGNCYTVFDNLSSIPSNVESVSTSTDGGLTWGAPVTTAPAARGTGAQPLVQPNGHVVVPFRGACGPPPQMTQMCAYRSIDGGDSWQAPVVISRQPSRPTARTPGLRSPPLPSAAVDREGRIYVVWKDCRFEVDCNDNGASPDSLNDIVLTTSHDGVHWEPVRRLPLDPVGSDIDHFIPGIDVDPASANGDARLALTYYFCGASDCKLKVGFVSSTDGGQTWSRREVLAGAMKLSWLAPTDGCPPLCIGSGGAMVGDYISTSVLNGPAEPGEHERALALPAFAVAFAPEPGTLPCAAPDVSDPDVTCHEAIFAAREEIRGGHLPAEEERAPELVP